MNKNISTIRRKITLPIILLILAALCLFGCVACAHEFLTEEDVKKDFPIAVIFDYNGGNVEGEATTKNSRQRKQLCARTRERAVEQSCRADACKVHVKRLFLG